MKDVSKRIKRLLVPAYLMAFLVIPMSVMARATPVEVQNFPEVQAVEDVHHPAKQPYHWDDYRSADIDTSTSLGIGVSTELVPEGKKLVIDHVSYKVTSTGFQAAPTVTLDILYEDSSGNLRWVVTHYLIPQRYQGAYDRLNYIGSQPMKLVLGPNMRIQIAASALVTEDTTITGAVSGYFVDMD